MLRVHVRLLSSSGFIVLAFSPYCDSSRSPHLIVVHRVRLSELVASREARDACRVHCDFFSVFNVLMIMLMILVAPAPALLNIEELPSAMLPWAKC